MVCAKLRLAVHCLPLLLQVGVYGLALLLVVVETLSQVGGSSPGNVPMPVSTVLLPKVACLFVCTLLQFTVFLVVTVGLSRALRSPSARLVKHHYLAIALVLSSFGKLL